jgi:hypothetical protein
MIGNGADLREFLFPSLRICIINLRGITLRAD